MTRTALPAILTVLLATSCLVSGLFHPVLNYDAIPYAALAKQLRGAGGKSEAYQEMAAKVGDRRFQIYVTEPYRERMYRDDQFFKINLPLYTIRPLYIALCSAVGALIHNDIAATHVVSALATALAILLSYFLAGALGLARPWRLAVPLIWIACGAINLAGLSTPDGVETLLTLLFVLVSSAGPWKGLRMLWLALIAILMVACRTDAVLLLGFLLLAEWGLETRNRLASVAILAATALTYLVIQRLSRNDCYIAVLNFQLIGNRAHSVVPNLIPNLHGYLVAVVR